MTWKVRHEGSPRAIENLTLPQVIEGLRDGLWEPTDEVMGPDDPRWVAIENHAQFAEAVADFEPPPRSEPEDESRLDMNPLIDVTLVLLIFFILTTTTEIMRKELESPSAVASRKGGLRQVPREKIKADMIAVVVRQEAGKSVVKVDGEVVALDAVADALAGAIRKTRKTELFLDVADDVPYGVEARIRGAAQKAGITKAIFPAEPAKAP